ncbi:MAG: hypothetical protein HC810_03255 [Acaryochloridaceae cyanobacterium RL_2_7]|nr:hypothetical protein [Acaryochloridaceae cyanobacterium RL_2_7]
MDDDRQELNAFVDETLDVKDVDLTNCDREPIHRPNAIQPHGLLLVFDGNTLDMVQVSANIESMTGHSPASLKGKTLKRLFCHSIKLKP